jgi:hypothetical protein
VESATNTNIIPKNRFFILFNFFIIIDYCFIAIDIAYLILNRRPA